MRNIITILLVIVSTSAWAQVEVGDVISAQHKDKLEKLDDPRKKLHKYRKFYSKDSTNHIKLNENLLVEKTDSLLDIFKDRPNLLASNSTESNILDSQVTTTDYLQSQTEEFAELQNLCETNPELFGQYKDLLSDVNQYDEGSLSSGLKAKGENQVKELSGKAQEKAAKRIGVDEIENQTLELKQSQSAIDDYKKQGEQLHEQGNIKQKVKEESRKKAAAFMAANQELVTAEEKKLELLKGKYSSVLNSNDFNTGVKLNSLEDRTFRERLIVGGNFQIVEAKPLVLSLSPMIGYRFNKRLSSGLAGNLRIAEKNAKLSNSKNATGGKVFTQYNVITTFLAIGEYELMNTNFTSSSGNETKSEWIPGAFLGIGRQFSIHPMVSASVSVLYNFLYKPGKSPYTNAFVFRFGFQLSELAMLKKKK